MTHRRPHHFPDLRAQREIDAEDRRNQRRLAVLTTLTVYLPFGAALLAVAALHWSL